MDFDKEKLGKALLHYTTAELMFVFVGIPLLILLIPFVIVTYGFYLVAGVLSFIGGVITVFFRQFKLEDSYSLPQEIGLILSPIVITPIFSGLAGTILYALSKSEQKAEEGIEKVEEKVRRVEEKAESEEDGGGESDDEEDSDEEGSEDEG